LASILEERENPSPSHPPEEARNVPKLGPSWVAILDILETARGAFGAKDVPDSNLNVAREARNDVVVTNRPEHGQIGMRSYAHRFEETLHAALEGVAVINKDIERLRAKLAGSQTERAT
jgi:hypothetical protein